MRRRSTISRDTEEEGDFSEDRLEYSGLGLALGVGVAGSGFDVYASAGLRMQFLGPDRVEFQPMCASPSRHNHVQHVPESPTHLPDTVCPKTTKAGVDFQNFGLFRSEPRIKLPWLQVLS